MYLKRIYDKPEGWVKETRVERQKDGRELLVCTNPPKVKHVQIKAQLTTPEWHLATDMAHVGISEGWLIMGNGKAQLVTDKGPVYFTIIRPPGRYCLHCGAVLPDDGNEGAAARAHVAAMHPDAAPIKQGEGKYATENKSGYEWISYWDLLLDKAHEKLVKPTAPVRKAVTHG